jgi:TetR/AcrR family transcriptional repressor of nem operon
MSNQTRTALLDEAEFQIRHVGYSTFSYADLAAKIGITKASIHHHFPTKERLGHEVIARGIGRFRESLEAIERSHSNAADRLHAYSELFMEGFELGQLPLCCALAAELTSLPQNVQSSVRDYFEVHLHWLHKVLEAGIAREEIHFAGTIESTAVTLLSLFEGASIVARAIGSRAPFESAYTQAITLIGAQAKKH